jgi:hypothetical protein
MVCRPAGPRANKGGHSTEALRPRQRLCRPSRPENHFMKGLSLAVPSPKGWHNNLSTHRPDWVFLSASVPRVALRSALGYLILPLWGGRIDPSPPRTFPSLPRTSPCSLRGISFPLGCFDALLSHFGSSTISRRSDIQDSMSNDFPST